MLGTKDELNSDQLVVLILRYMKICFTGIKVYWGGGGAVTPCPIIPQFLVKWAYVLMGMGLKAVKTWDLNRVYYILYNQEFLTKNFLIMKIMPIYSSTFG